MWNKIRVPVAVVLMTVAAFLVGKNLGYREGIAVKYGGPGTFKTAIVEWQDYSERKVVLYLNDGANGYAFWFQMDPRYKHYSYSAKVFAANNEQSESIKNAMDNARDWCKNEWEGGDTRISSGEWKPRGDADAELLDSKTVVVGSNEWLELVALREAIEQARKDNAELLQERDSLRKKLGTDK